MKKVVLLLRVSTNSQDYEYQRSTLTDLCNRNGWEIVRTFENKVSGAKKNEEREEIVELLGYIKNNEVDMVMATEVSRVGRNTLEALKTIEILNENKVNLYFANYNIETLLPDKSVNPIARLILTICLRQQANAVPRKVKKLSMALMFCFMLIYVAVIGYVLVTSLGSIL